MNQAISFSGSPTSYFQASGFTSLGISNQPFSITLWIRPQVLSGTIIHLSITSLGTGSQCFPLLGFDRNGFIFAQVLTEDDIIVAVTGPLLPISTSWTAIAQTWSPMDGLKLYINNTLVSSGAASTFLGSETTPNYLTLGNSVNGNEFGCKSGSITAAGPFTGAVDDLRIYTRELSTDELCILYVSS